MDIFRCCFSASALIVVLAASGANGQQTRFNEYKVLEEHKLQRNSFTSPLPYTYLDPDDLPASFSWGDVGEDHVSYLTHSLNQHIPQYCGSCWAHGALSALSDRIKIARKGMGDEINLSIQYILNCGGRTAGSCHGGSHTAVYQFIKETGFVPYDTCLPYLACSSESTDGFCPYVDTTCSPINTCRTCVGGTGDCFPLTIFPNASIAEYGTYSYYTGGFGAVADKIKAEIYARGPVATAVNAIPLTSYAGGIVNNTKFWNMLVNHIVSIVGWGSDPESGEQYWIVRNSWGQYWGEMGYFRIVMGKNSLGIESEVAWATLKSFTVENFPCNEDGSNCRPKNDEAGPTASSTFIYQDPSTNPDIVTKRRHLLRV